MPALPVVSATMRWYKPGLLHEESPNPGFYRAIHDKAEGRKNGGWAKRDNPTDCCAEAWTCRPSIKTARKSVDAEGYQPSYLTLKGQLNLPEKSG